MMNFISDHIGKIIIGFVFIIIGIGIYCYVNQDEWTTPFRKCLRSHTQTTMIYNGKTMIPIVQNVCTKYSDEIYIKNNTQNILYKLVEVEK